MFVNDFIFVRTLYKNCDIILKMERIILRLSGTLANDCELTENVDVKDGENYHSALSRSLKKAQTDFNTLLTEVIEKDKRRLSGKIYWY